MKQRDMEAHILILADPGMAQSTFLASAEELAGDDDE